MACRPPACGRYWASDVAGERGNRAKALRDAYNARRQRGAGIGCCTPRWRSPRFRRGTRLERRSGVKGTTEVWQILRADSLRRGPKSRIGDRASYREVGERRGSARQSYEVRGTVQPVPRLSRVLRPCCQGRSQTSLARRQSTANWRPGRSPRSRGAVGVGDVAGERGDRAARLSRLWNRGDFDAAVADARPGRRLGRATSMAPDPGVVRGRPMRSQWSTTTFIEAGATSEVRLRGSIEVGDDRSSFSSR